MQNAIVVTGRLVGPKSVELDEPVSDVNADVQVIVHPGGEGSRPAHQGVIEFLRDLAPGTRSRQDIDQKLGQERQAWE